MKKIKSPTNSAIFNFLSKHSSKENINIFNNLLSQIRDKILNLDFVADYNEEELTEEEIAKYSEEAKIAVLDNEIISLMRRALSMAEIILSNSAPRDGQEDGTTKEPHSAAIQDLVYDLELALDSGFLTDKPEPESLFIEDFKNDINDALGDFDIYDEEGKQIRSFDPDWKTLISGPAEERDKILEKYNLNSASFVKLILNTPIPQEEVVSAAAKKLIKDIIRLGKGGKVKIESDVYNWVSKVRDSLGETFQKSKDFGNFDMFFDYFSQPQTAGQPATEDSIRDELYNKYDSKLHPLITDLSAQINSLEKSQELTKNFDIKDFSQSPVIADILSKTTKDLDLLLKSLGLSQKMSKYKPIIGKIKLERDKFNKSNWKDLGALRRIVENLEIMADDPKNSSKDFSDKVYGAKKELLDNNWFVFVSSLDNFLESSEKLIRIMSEEAAPRMSQEGDRIIRRERGFLLDEELLLEIKNMYNDLYKFYESIINNPKYIKSEDSRGELSSLIGQFKIMAESFFNRIFSIASSQELVTSEEDFATPESASKESGKKVRGRITKTLMQMAKDLKIIEIYDKDLAFALLKSISSAPRAISASITYCKVYRGA